MDSGSYVVGFPWLPVLAQYLKQQRSVEGSGGLDGDVPPLASPTLEQLYATDSAQMATEGVPPKRMALPIATAVSRTSSHSSI